MKTLKPSIPTLGSTPSTRGWKPDTERGNRHQRGYGSEWEKTRVRILHRDHGTCQPGLKIGETHIATQVDHIISKAEARALGWTTEQVESEANLQAICDTCHKAKTARESNRS